MASLNRVLLIGNLGQDPEKRFTPSGQPVTTFSIATTERWKDRTSGQQQERTEWHRIVVWGQQAENCAQYLSKGRPVFVEGRLQTRQWEDKEGAKRTTTEVIAQRVLFLGSGQGGGAKARADQTPMDTEVVSFDTGGPDDEVPF
jgi:single-strand DNA-binding protein